MSPTLTTETAALTPADRCDRCGARAYVRAVLAEGDLLFCAHHARVFADRLKKVAVTVHDDAGVLTGNTPPED